MKHNCPIVTNSDQVPKPNLQAYFHHMKLLLYSSSVGSYCTSIGMLIFMVYIPIFKNSMRRISDGNSKSWRLKRGPQSCVSFMSEIFRTSSVQKELLVSGKKVQRNILNKLRHVSISLKAEVRIMFRKHASTMTMCRFSIDWNSIIVWTFGIGTFVLSWRLRKQQFCEEDASHQVT